MMSKVIWQVASILLLLIGVGHLAGTLFTTLLHPVNNKLMEDMKVSPINVDTKAIIWKAWIGFNATFATCLIFIALTNFYLAYQHFDLLKGFSALSMATVLCTFFLSWIAHKYLIKKVTRIFLIAFILFVIAMILSR